MGLSWQGSIPLGWSVPQYVRGPAERTCLVRMRLGASFCELLLLPSDVEG